MDTRAPDWTAELGRDGLRDLLLETARAEVGRRRQQLPAGTEPGALAQQAAGSALAQVAADLGENRRAPLAIWAVKFVMAEVSAKIAQQQWRAGSRPVAEGDWAAQLAGRLGLVADAGGGPAGGSADVLGSLLRGVQQDLTTQQRAVFQAVLLGTPLDVLAVEFGSTRSASYKSMFEARRRLGDRLAADGHNADPLGPLPPALPSGLADLLAVTPGDAGCEVTFQELDSYVSSELSAGGPSQDLAAVRVHLDSCAACQQDYQGLLAAGRAAGLADWGVHPARSGSS